MGSGYQKFEFDRFGVRIEDAPAIFNEFLDVIQLGLTEKGFSFEGKHIQLPQTSISIRSVQKPMPPIWLATGHPEVQARAIREGYNLFVTALLNGTDKLKQMREGLSKVAAAARPRHRRHQGRPAALRLRQRQRRRDHELPRERALPAADLRSPEVPPRAFG